MVLVIGIAIFTLIFSQGPFCGGHENKTGKDLVARQMSRLGYVQTTKEWTEREQHTRTKGVCQICERRLERRRVGFSDS